MELDGSVRCERFAVRARGASVTVVMNDCLVPYARMYFPGEHLLRS
jgi:hypothetical protein